MTYLYIAANGDMAGTGSTRIDPPDVNHADYIDGQYSEYWDASWVRRLDSDVVGYPSSGQVWDFDTNSWSISKEALKQEAKAHRMNLELNSSISYLGLAVPIDTTSLGIFTALAQAARLENPEDMIGVSYDLNKDSVLMTNADFIGLADAVFNHVQSIIDADILIMAQIEAGTITDISSIPSAFQTAMSQSYPHLNPITDLYNTIKGKQGKIQPMAHVEAVQADAATDMGTDVQEMKGLVDVEEAVVAANIAQNAMAVKYNDLATKFNALLAHLESQALMQSE